MMKLEFISSCKGFGRCTLEAHERSLFWTDVSIFVSREWNRCSEAEDRLWIHSTRKMSFETKLLFSLTMRKTAPSDSGCLKGLQCTGDETVLCWKGCRLTVWRCGAGDRKSVGWAASRKKASALQVLLQTDSVLLIAIQFPITTSISLRATVF